MSPHLITRATILGTGLIGGSFALALRSADLIYIALPIGVTLDLLPEIARLAPKHALVTDACSTKLRIAQSAAENFSPPATAFFLGGHPMAGREVAGLAQADADLFRNAPYALIADSSVPADSAPSDRDPRVSAFLKLLEKIGARPLWLGAQQHDYAVGMVSHLPQLAAVALGSLLYDHLDENGLPITVAGPGLRDSLRLAGSPDSTWRAL